MSESRLWLLAFCLPALLTGAAPAHAQGPDESLLDPTMPQGWQVPLATVDDGDAPQANLMLQGTYSVAGRRSAVISGRRVAVGDRVQGAEVVRVDKDRVVLRRDGEALELTLPLPNVKTAIGGDKTASSHTAGELGRYLK